MDSAMFTIVETTDPPGIVYYLPIATTVLAAVFASRLLLRWRSRGGRHLLWWGIGVTCYGIGTALESAVTLVGNSMALTKAWYVAGAVLGAYPLAQGTVHLLFAPHKARILTLVSLPFVVVLALLVLFSPVIPDNLEAVRPTGAILSWTWLRAMTPLVNGYAVVFLIGGATYSAIRDSRSGHGHRAAGNSLIAIGAILPGISGAMAKTGFVEALYVGELVGLVLIWTGAGLCVRRPRERASA